LLDGICGVMGGDDNTASVWTMNFRGGGNGVGGGGGGGDGDSDTANDSSTLMDTTTLSSLPRIDETQSTSLVLLAEDDDSLMQSDVVQTYTAAALASPVVSTFSRATTSAAVATNTIRNDNDDNNSSSVNQSNINNNINTTMTSTASSVRHPSRRHHLPPAAALQRARDELEAGRMRLTAHGVTSRARTVYLRYDSDTEILLWQTEAARRRQSSSEDTSWNRLPLANVLFVDVGKKTMALMRQTAVDEEHCLSLLTAAGSLDLQAPSAAQRDALVSVLASLLDQVHDRDWRLLYEETASTAVMGVPSSSAS